MALEKIRSIKIGFKSKKTENNLDVPQSTDNLDINASPKKKQKKEPTFFQQIS